MEANGNVCAATATAAALAVKLNAAQRVAQRIRQNADRRAPSYDRTTSLELVDGQENTLVKKLPERTLDAFRMHELLQIAKLAACIAQKLKVRARRIFKNCAAHQFQKDCRPVRQSLRQDLLRLFSRNRTA